MMTIMEPQLKQRRAVITACLIIVILLLTSYTTYNFQHNGNSNSTTTSRFITSKYERIITAETIRNTATTSPHLFGINKHDVHTIRIVDIVPSSVNGDVVKYVHLQQVVGGVPVVNTALNAVVKLTPSSPPQSSSLEEGGTLLSLEGNHYLRSHVEPTTQYTNTNAHNNVHNNVNNRHEGIVKITNNNSNNNQQYEGLIQNIEKCINVYTPTLSADDALKMAVGKVLGVTNVTPFRRRRVLIDEEDGGNLDDNKFDSNRDRIGRDSRVASRVGSHGDKSRHGDTIRQRSVFEAQSGISIDDTPCQLSYWSIVDNNDVDNADGTMEDNNCNVRLSWECIVKPNITNYMHIFVDAVDGSILHVAEFGRKGGGGGEKDEEDEEEEDGGYNILQQQETTAATTTTTEEEPLRHRRLSAFSAVQYPLENPCPNCPKYKLNMTDSESKFNVADIEPLTLVSNPEYKPSSPNGWLTIGDITYQETRGNNVRAAVKLLQDSIDYYDSGITASATDPKSQVFDYSYQSVIHEGDAGDKSVAARLDSSVSASLEAAVVNAFYWANIIHDVYYQYGFDEESGNFQEDNFGKGGLGSDSVVVEVRETNTFNNAFMMNAVDGENPMLLLYLFIKSDTTYLRVDGYEYKAKPFAFGPTEFNITDASIVYSRGRVCQSLKDNAYFGNIVVIDEGDCSFSKKVKNAQNRGATAVIIVSDPWDRPGMFSIEDPDPSIYIPSVSITKQDAESLEAKLQPTSGIELGPGLIVRDTAFDNSIIIHEYCHGITTRLTGGPSTTFCLMPEESRELGKEGWEDICSLFLTATESTGRTRTLGSFANWSVFGIRPYPYSTDLTVNPSTYGWLNRESIGSHMLGSIFGSMLWDLYWAMIDHAEENGQLGFNSNKYESAIGGSNIAMQLIVEGLKIQPCNPSFVQSRDAILVADELLYDQAYKCVIWKAFAKRGLGEGAISLSSGSALNVTESFDVPIYCRGPWITLTSYSYTIGTGDGDRFIDDCEVLKLSITFVNSGSVALTDLQLIGVSSNVGTVTVVSKLPMQLPDMPERSRFTIDIELMVDGLQYDQPLELEAKFSAASESLPSIFVTFTETSTDIVTKEKVDWQFGGGNDEDYWTAIDGQFSLEPSRSSLAVDGVSYYSPVAMFGPQQFSLTNVVIQDGGLGCDQVADDAYAGSVVLLERGECDFGVKVENAQNSGAIAVVIMAYPEEHPFNMVAGQNVNIDIPAVMVGNVDGQRIRQSIDTALATLTFDAQRKEILSSFLPIPGECNRVRSPSFVLNANSSMSIWVNFGISGTSDDFIFDRANVGLFSGGKRVTIIPDDGHKYNSVGEVSAEVNAIEGCPAPGVMGWRKRTGSSFVEVIFSSEALQAAADMIGEMVQLDIALATGLETHGSYFSIKKVKLANVGIPMPDEGNLCSMSSATPSSSLPGDNASFTESNTFTTSALPGSDLPESDNNGSSKGDVGGVDSDSDQSNAGNTTEGASSGGGGGMYGALAILILAIPLATLLYVRHKRRKEAEELHRANNFSELANPSDLENPMNTLDAVEVSLAVPVSVEKGGSCKESENKSRSDRRNLSAMTESLSFSSSASSEAEDDKHDDDEAQDQNITPDDMVDDEGVSRMMSFLDAFVPDCNIE